MKDIRNIFNKVEELKISIDKLVRESTFLEYDDLSGLKVDYKDPEQILLLDELKHIINELADLSNKIGYLQKPIIHEGKLYKNEEGRYGTSNGYYYTCGSGIEALIYDECYEGMCWVRSSVEYDHEFYNDYYIVGYKNMPLDGLVVRQRSVK